MFGAPTATPYDLRFSIAGIPVRVHPLFWLVSAVFGFVPGDPGAIFVWIAAVFVSILIHELGHAFTMRYFGYGPAVVLYAGGGLAMYHGDTTAIWSNFGNTYRRGRDDPWARIIVAAAGPAAGFLLALITLLGLVLAGFSIVFMDITIGTGDSLAASVNQYLFLFIFNILYICIWWGLINLLPIYPLDGGQIARELFEMYSRDGLRQSLWLSLIAAVAVALIGFTQLQSNFIGFMFAYFAFLNWQMLQSFTGRGGYGGGYGGGPW